MADTQATTNDTGAGAVQPATVEPAREFDVDDAAQAFGRALHPEDKTAKKPEKKPASAAQERPRESGPDEVAQEIDGDGAETPTEAPDRSGEVESETTIDPPQFWTSAEKEAFAKLPPDLQKVISDKERERSRDISTKLQEAAEERKKALSDATSQFTERQRQLEHQLREALPGAVREFQAKYGKIDWVALSQSDPSQYVQLKAQHEAEYNRIRQAAQAYDQEQQNRAAEAKVTAEKWVANQEARLVRAVPEWKDVEKGKAELAEIRNWAAGDERMVKDMTSEEIAAWREQLSGLQDAKLILLLRDAFRHNRAAKNALKAAEAGKVPPPKVQKPGATEPRRNGQAERTAATFNRLRRSGSVDDAAALFRQGLEQKDR